MDRLLSSVLIVAEMQDAKIKTDGRTSSNTTKHCGQRVGWFYQIHVLGSKALPSSVPLLDATQHGVFSSASTPLPKLL